MTLTPSQIAAVEDYARTRDDQHLVHDCDLARLGWVKPCERVAEALEKMKGRTG